jgi:hypothetical protein
VQVPVPLSLHQEGRGHVNRLSCKRTFLMVGWVWRKRGKGLVRVLFWRSLRRCECRRGGHPVTYMVPRLGRLPNPFGMVPSSRLLSKYKFFSRARFPIASGMIPVSWLFCT